MRLLLLLVISLTINTSFAQEADTIWYNSKWEKTDKTNRHYYRVVKRDEAKDLFYVRDFYPGGQTQMEGYYTSFNPEIRNGEFKWWFENGNRQREALFNNDMAIKMVEWELNGSLKSQWEVIQAVTYKDGVPIVELKAVEASPVFPGGAAALSRFIVQNVRYPVDAVKKGIKGKVIVMFVVNDKGKVTDPEVVQSIYPSLDKEALRVVHLMPRWEPGKQGGKYINAKISLPILFK